MNISEPRYNREQSQPWMDSTGDKIFTDKGGLYCFPFYDLPKNYKSNALCSIKVLTVRKSKIKMKQYV